jgi:hypothetical protein
VKPEMSLSSRQVYVVKVVVAASKVDEEESNGCVSRTL